MWISSLDEESGGRITAGSRRLFSSLEEDGFRAALSGLGFRGLGFSALGFFVFEELAFIREDLCGLGLSFSTAYTTGHRVVGIELYLDCLSVHMVGNLLFLILLLFLGFPSIEVSRLAAFFGWHDGILRYDFVKHWRVDYCTLLLEVFF